MTRASDEAPPPGSPSQPDPPLPRGARLGRRIAQVLFFSVLVWVIVSGAAQMLGEGVFAPRVPRDGTACRAELALLRARLAEAVLAHESDKGEAAAVASFRKALGGEAAQAWDARVQELVDGCPAQEAAAAYALARLRAGHEAMIRVDADELGPARLAHRRALEPLPQGGHPPPGSSSSESGAEGVRDLPKP